jgi:ATP-dependent Clp protease ATP-binding subunit ClpA
VTTENMLVGLLRVQDGVFAEFFTGSGTDMRQLRSMIGARLLPDRDPLNGQELPADPAAAAALQTAAAEADARRRKSVSPLHLLAGILSQQSQPGAQVLTRLGMDDARMRERLESAL